MRGKLSRREMLVATTGVALSFGAARKSGAATEVSESAAFSYCLNTSTIRGQELTLVQELEVAAKAGYTAIEPWVREIQQHVEAGGSLRDLRSRIRDLGLTVESAIAFPEWIVDDDTRRMAALEQAKREMDLLAQIDGKRIAAPPVGATEQPGLNLLKAAERYRALLELGDEMGIVPQVEVWGFSQNLHLLGQSMFVLIESGHPKACLLPDVYQIYKGGGSFHGLNAVSGKVIQVMHMNDYPAQPGRTEVQDRDRVYPGDGVAPMGQILRNLNAKGEPIVLSLELFNPEYWRLDALTVAKTGLEKMRAAVDKALEG